MIVNSEVIAENRREATRAAVLFGVLMALIPLGLGWFWVAPFVGLAVGFAVFGLFTGALRRRAAQLAQPFPEAWRQILESDVAYYNQLKPEDQERFRQLVQTFLAEIPVTGVEMALTDQHRVLAAASAVIPILGFPDWEYRYLSEVLLYPASFDHDYATKGGDRRILGMVSGQLNNGVVILSAPALITGFKNPTDKNNVGIHEFAHMVDKADGSIDGMPASLPKALFEPWLELLAERLAEEVKGKPDIKHYGRTNEQEFFAVVTEYFFENPAALERKHPELYALLKDIFRQDPAHVMRNHMLVKRKGKRKAKNKAKAERRRK